MVATCFLALVAIPALLGGCGQVHVAGAVSFWHTHFIVRGQLFTSLGLCSSPVASLAVAPFATNPRALVSAAGCAQEEWQHWGGWHLLGQLWGSSGQGPTSRRKWD